MVEETIQRLLNRKPDSYKYDYGHVLVVGGSPGMVGAPLLTAMAALRIGAGLVTVASTAAVIKRIAGRVPELMTLTFDKQPETAAQQVQAFITDRKVSILAIGPGMAAPQADVLKAILQTVRLPIVADGGALSVLGQYPEVLELHDQLVLTPHAGELQTFFATQLPKERQQLKRLAEEFMAEKPQTLIVKGEPTYVIQSVKETYENTTGTPALATAGSGDILTGIIAGIMAQHIEPFAAATAAVHLHGLAGTLAANDKTVIGVIASDIVDYLATALKTVRI